jgi:hypothetical protein
MSPAPEIRARNLATVVTVVLAVLVVSMAAGLGYVVVELGNVVEKIQDERVRNIRDSCESQNERHDATLKRLGQRAPDQEAAGFAGELIEALAPHRDCNAVVRRQTGASAP